MMREKRATAAKIDVDEKDDITDTGEWKEERKDVAETILFFLG